MTIVSHPIFSLPNEIFAKIILMTEYEDIMNFMLVSNGLRDLIFNTPEVMKMIQINIKPNYNELKAASTFIEHRGNSFRFLKFKLHDMTGPIIKFILEQTPNLEELILKNDKFIGKNGTDLSEQFDVNLPELPKLRILQLEVFDLRNFLINAKNIKSLEKFSVCSESYEDSEMILTFLNQQSNLKELSIEAKNYEHSDFVEYFCAKANLQLTVFKFKLCSLWNERYIINFLRTQKTLEELEFYEEPGKEILQFIFEQLKDLKKLSILKTNNRPQLFRKIFQPIQIDTLVYFEGDYSVDLHQIISKFPNITTLKCKNLKADEGIFDKITTLELKVLDLEILTDVEFPNLKNFSVTRNVKNCFNTDSCEAWKRFATKIKNVENISIKYAGDRYEFSDIDFFKGLKCFQNLQTFTYRHMQFGNLSDKPVPENESIKAHDFYTKVVVDGQKKTVRVSNFLVDRYKAALKILFDTFQGYQFIEFCFEDLWERPLFYKTAMTYYLTRNNKRPADYKEVKGNTKRKLE